MKKINNYELHTYPLFEQVTVQSGTVSDLPYSKIALTCSLGSQSEIIILLLILYNYILTKLEKDSCVKNNLIDTIETGIH